MPVLEDISEDESGELLKENVQPAAMVSAVFVGVERNADNIRTVNVSTDDAPAVLDEVKKNYEMRVIATLMQKIQEIGLTYLSSRYADMQASFPEVSAERIAALFEWTVWVSRLRSGENVDDTVSDLNISEGPKAKQTDPQAIFVGSRGSAARADDAPCRDPMLSGLDILPPSRNSSPIKENDELDGSFPKSLDGDGNLFGAWSEDAANDDAVMLLSNMFPELHPVAEEEFDFCE